MSAAHDGAFGNAAVLISTRFFAFFSRIIIINTADLARVALPYGWLEQPANTPNQNTNKLNHEKKETP
jgi:hypothetical protein